MDLRKEITTNAKAREIISKVVKPNMSDLQKELALHDYVISNTKYDSENYIKNTIPKDSYSPYGALVNGIAVCQGYAEAMNLLETMIVVGDTDGENGWESHVWNIVKIDGVYYQLGMILFLIYKEELNMIILT